LPIPIRDTEEGGRLKPLWIMVTRRDASDGSSDALALRVIE